MCDYWEDLLNKKNPKSWLYIWVYCALAYEGWLTDLMHVHPLCSYLWLCFLEIGSMMSLFYTNHSSWSHARCRMWQYLMTNHLWQTIYKHVLTNFTTCPGLYFLRLLLPISPQTSESTAPSFTSGFYTPSASWSSFSRFALDLARLLLWFCWTTSMSYNVCIFLHHEHRQKRLLCYFLQLLIYMESFQFHVH